VRTGRAHAALVFDQEGAAQGWCQYGSPEELGFKHLREYLKDPAIRRLADHLHQVDKRHRGQGDRARRTRGAHWRRSRPPGGGLVESILEVATGRQAQGRFLFSATVELFEQYGFARGRQVGKHVWIVSRRVDG
jgi:hypothetical protein